MLENVQYFENYKLKLNRFYWLGKQDVGNKEMLEIENHSTLNHYSSNYVNFVSFSKLMMV